MSDTATPQTLIDQLLPAIMATFDASKPTIVADIPNPIVREAVDLSWKWIDTILPIEIQTAYAAILAKFGSMTINDIVTLVAADTAILKERKFAVNQIRAALNEADATLKAVDQ